MSGSFIVDAVRTPLGRINGALSSVRPDDLAAGVLAGLWQRHEIDDTIIDDVILGNSNGAGEDNRNVARMALLLAGLATSVPGVSVNRLCGSGLEAVVQASRELVAGDADVVIAGGVESVSYTHLDVYKRQVRVRRWWENARRAFGWRRTFPTGSAGSGPGPAAAGRRAN